MKRTLRAAIGACAGVLLIPTLAGAAELKVGDRAPDFSLPDQNGRVVKLSNFRGKKNVVLAFYVLAFTGG